MNFVDQFNRECSSIVVFLLMNRQIFIVILKNTKRIWNIAFINKIYQKFYFRYSNFDKGKYEYK